MSITRRKSSRIYLSTVKSMNRKNVLIALLFVLSGVIFACQSGAQLSAVALPIDLPTATPTPIHKEAIPLGSVKPRVDLSAKQKKYLNESLPSVVRTILENAESFEILAEVNKDESVE